MKAIEKCLEEEKKRIESITAPEKLEGRLRKALTNTKKHHRFIFSWKLSLVALLILSLFIGFHFNALAYYGKKFIGFDELMNDTIQELNERGMGQSIDQSFFFNDGTKVTINGIIADANRVLLYYTLSNKNGFEDISNDSFRPEKLTGFFTNSNQLSGTGSMNKDKTEIKWEREFEAVNAFSKKLTLHYSYQYQNGEIETGTVSFSYNPNEAIQKEMKQRINKTISVDKGKLIVKSITATPTMTTIKGKFNIDNYDRLPIGLDGVELVANGKKIEMFGSGTQSTINGRKFEIRYDVLPEQLQSMELIVTKFVGYEKLNEKISLQTIHEDQPIYLSGKELYIKDVVTTSDGVEVKIVTDDSILLDGVSIGDGNKDVALKTTVNHRLFEMDHGETMKERTLLFNKVIQPEYLTIEGMHLIKEYNEKINIPIKTK